MISQALKEFRSLHPILVLQSAGETHTEHGANIGWIIEKLTEWTT